MASRPDPVAEFAADVQPGELLSKIDTASIALADAEKVERAKDDEFLLARAARTQMLNRPGGPISDEQFQAALARVRETDQARVNASALASAARRTLDRLLKQAETQANREI